MEPPVFLIVGPTGVGKTELAIELARQHGAEIVSADAFQIYRGLDILNAKPSPAEMETVPHHLIGIVSLNVEYDVAQWLSHARTVVKEIAARGKPVIICGGAGLYIRALTHGLDDIPPPNSELRTRLRALPLDELQRALKERDSGAAQLIDMQNPRRVARALEIAISSGKNVAEFRQRWQGRPSRAYRGVLLLRDREELIQRLELRTLRMFDLGVVAEAKVASEGPISETASRILGLREVLEFARGDCTREDAILRITRASSRYAKRQLTWFRRDSSLRSVNLTLEPPSAAAELFAQFRKETEK